MGAPSNLVRESTTDARWRQRLFVSLTLLTWIAILLLVIWLLSHVVLAILLFVIAAVVSYAVTPFVDLLCRWLPRGLAIAISYVVGVVILLGLVVLVGYTASTQVVLLVRALPGYFDKARYLEPRLLSTLNPLGIGSGQLDGARALLLDQAHAAASSIAAGSFAVVKGTLSGFLSAILAFMISIYLTANGPRARHRLIEAAGRLRYGERIADWVVTVNQIVGGYVRATLTLAGMVGVLVGGSMAVLGLPYALLLGVIAFFMEFIPVIGVMISGAICILIALGVQGWQKALIVWGVFVLVHVLEGDVVGPRVRGKAVGIHPVTALLALVAGTELWGVWGALLGAPIAGLLQAFVVAGYRSFAGTDELMTEEGRDPIDN